MGGHGRGALGMSTIRVCVLRKSTPMKKKSMNKKIVILCDTLGSSLYTFQPCLHLSGKRLRADTFEYFP